MNILPTAYAPRQGESLGKHSLQKIDAIPEEVRSAIDDGLNDIRFNGYRWECNAKTGWARVSPISSPADAEPESPEQSQQTPALTSWRYKVSIYQSRRKLKARRNQLLIS